MNNMYSPAAKIIKNTDVKEVFTDTEPKSLSPYINMVKNDLFALCGTDILPYSTTELKLMGNSRLDIICADQEFIYKGKNKSRHTVISPKTKAAIIIENQFGPADATHRKKIFDYMLDLTTQCKKIKKIDYYWIAESHTDSRECMVLYSNTIEQINSWYKYKGIDIKFHRIEFRTEIQQNEPVVIFTDIDNPETMIKLPYKYAEKNAELNNEKTLGISSDLNYPAVFETLTERYIYNLYAERINETDKSCRTLFIDGLGCKDDEPVKIITKNIYKGITVEYKTIEEIKGMPKFDYIIQNPPYAGTLHTKFFENGLDMLSETGKMTIIEPATWLINIRTNGKNCGKIYPAMKERVKGHVKSIRIDDLNSQFNIDSYIPLSITEIDMSKTYDTIECNVCGDKFTVSDIYDCNLIGKYKTVWSILNKVKSYGDMMRSHTTKTEIKGYKYLPYKEILTDHGYESKNDYVKSAIGTYYGTYTTPALHKNKRDIYDEVGLTATGNPNPCVYGTYDELTNWKHFILTNKLPLFINMCITIDQHNNSVDYLPWLVDRQYTDDEINGMFKFTPEEISLIDYTVMKFEISSPWFKRFMKGPDAVSDDEVLAFITNLKKTTGYNA